MEKLLTMDAQNYDPDLPEIYRVAVRGIIFLNGKLVLIRSNLGEVKFPGGGQEDGETDSDTLIRETLEETGYHVIPASIREFGEVEEKRLSTLEPMVWHQINRYYFCDVDGTKEECRYSENEKKHGFSQVCLPLDEAIKCNWTVLCREGALPWNQREYQVLRLLEAHLQYS